MKNSLRKIILGLSVVFTIFISLFALDVFEQEKWLLALIIHLIPTFTIMILIIISWKKELFGGILWLITGVLVILTTNIDLVVTLPVIIIGVLNILLAKVKNH